MPVYSMKNVETNEEFEITIKYVELETYLIDNPHIKQIFKKFPGYGDPVHLGIKRTDDGFRDALKEVKIHHKHNTINV